MILPPNVSTNPHKYQYYVLDSRTGDQLLVTRDICGRCKKPIMADESEHKPCFLATAEENAKIAEQLRQSICKEKYGQVFSIVEHRARDNPNEIMEEWGESWNKRQARLEMEKRQERLDLINARRHRKLQLSGLKAQLEYLERQVSIDEEEEEKEKTNG